METVAAGREKMENKKEKEKTSGQRDGEGDHAAPVGKRKQNGKWTRTFKNCCTRSRFSIGAWACHEIVTNRIGRNNPRKKNRTSVSAGCGIWKMKSVNH
jgi:hypothetical protein